MELRELWKQLECVDLSVPLSEDFPVTWPTLPPFRRHVVNWFEDFVIPSGQRFRSQGSYYAQSLQMDEHTGTHVDFPLHVLPLEELERMSVDVQPALENFAGPAVVVDATVCLDQAPPGKSPRVPEEILRDWEAEHGAIQPGEIVLLNTGYMDRYFAPLPEGNRLVREALLSGNVPGWPIPSDQVFELLSSRGVRHVGISSPSIGALDDPSGPHRGGIERGMTYAECLIHLDQLPPRGALYVGLPLRIAQQSGSPVRAVAFKPSRSRR